MSLVSSGYQLNNRSSSTTRSYTVPRTSFGQPDLEGVWTNNNATPLQRPAAWADKAFLTEAEVERIKSASRQLEQNGDALFGDGGAGDGDL